MKGKATKSTEKESKSRPALSLKARENQMIAYAMDVAEERLRDGTASSQLVTHFLKLGTTIAELEKQKLELETELIRAKTKAVASSENAEKLYTEAIQAFQRYTGASGGDDPDIF